MFLFHPIYDSHSQEVDYLGTGAEEITLVITLFYVAVEQNSIDILFYVTIKQ